VLKATSFSGRANSTIKVVDARILGRKIVIPPVQNCPDVFRSATGYFTKFLFFNRRKEYPSFSIP
jgi:hypothetical protein